MTARVDCTTVLPCQPDLGVCLSCVDGENPEWAWSEAPGSPYVFAVSPRNLSMTQEDMRQDCCWAHPFNHHVPDCARFEFDERGMPVRTRQVSGTDVEDVYHFAYDSDFRVTRVVIDQVPFCMSNDFGDESPCGVPDGEIDTSWSIEWDEVQGHLRARTPNSEWVFDADGGLRSWRNNRSSGRNQRRGGLIRQRFVRDGSVEVTARFRYDRLRHLVSVDRSVGERRDLLRWEYDARGWRTRRVFPSGTDEYENDYDAQGRLSRVRVHSAQAPTQDADGVFERRHDEHGLLVGVAIATPGRATAETGWERDPTGVPLTYVLNGVRVDQRCLQHLASRFVPSSRLRGQRQVPGRDPQ